MNRDWMRSIVEAKANDAFSLSLKWSDGTAALIDVSNLLRGRTAAQSAQVVVGPWGHSLEWASGDELSADALWLETLSATGRSDARAFLEWRLRNGLSLSAAATALGISRRMVAYYSNGERPVPKSILLACRGWEAERAAA